MPPTVKLGSADDSARGLCGWEGVGVTNNEAWIERLPPLVRAAHLGDAGAVSELLGSDADPCESDEDGWSALHAAAVSNSLEVVQLLIAAGAEVDARTKDGFTPLLNAADAGPGVVGALLAAGADPMAQDTRNSWRPLDRFAEYSNAEALRLLLHAGAEVNPKVGSSSGTALIDAAEAGSLECVQILLDAGADPRAQIDGDTAHSLAMSHGHGKIAAVLAAALERVEANRGSEA
jgi:ankyrin repeat protein